MLRNAQGEYTNTIKRGEDFYIGLQMTNRIGDTLYCYNCSGMRFLTNEEFLTIYRIDKDNTLRAMGKPFDRHIYLYPIGIQNSAPHLTKIPEGESAWNLGFNWLSFKANKPLGKGEYISYFEDSVVIRHFKPIVQNGFAVSFVDRDIPVKIKTVLRFTVE